MIIGVPREVKQEEYRVGITPYGVRELTRDNHSILIETGAGLGSGFSDGEYRSAGAEIVERKALFERSELIVKVKEPLPQEFSLLKEGQALFTYLHLAPNRGLLDLLLEKKITGIAYETLTVEGALPLLAPMSEIAGRMAPLMGTYYLQKVSGGSGILATGASGVRPAKIVILGAGVVGTNAARIASALGMETIVMNKGAERLRKIDELFMGRVETRSATEQTIAEETRDADIIVGAALVAGGRTPVLMSRSMLSGLKKGSVLVDVAVDQGGCFETSRPTTHGSPIFEVDGIIHYCVANMPGAYPRTSTLALTNATLPYLQSIAAQGITKAATGDPVMKTALNTYAGKIVHPTLAASIR